MRANINSIKRALKRGHTIGLQSTRTTITLSPKDILEDKIKPDACRQARQVLKDNGPVQVWIKEDLIEKRVVNS